MHDARGAVLHAAAARDPARAHALRPARVHATYDDVVADPDVDVVYVNLTNEAHRPHVLAALAAGKHVLCEKPLGLDAAEAAAMTDAARDAGRLLVEALWFRWHPRVRRVVELATSGALGPVHEVTATFTFRGDFTGAAAANYRLDPARGGGALLDTGCYVLSAAHAVLGPALDVGTATSRRGATGVDVETAATLRVPDGVPGAGGRARVRCGIDAAPEQVLRVVGEAATVECVPARHGAGAASGASSVADGGPGAEAFTTWREPSALLVRTPDGGTRVEEFAAVDAYVLMVEAVAAAVRGEPADLPGAAHSRAVATSSDAVRSAARERPGHG